MNNRFGIEVPFIENAGVHCGPICVFMAARYFGISTSLSLIAEFALTGPRGTWTIGMARAARLVGMEVEYCSSNLTGPNEDGIDLLSLQEKEAVETCRWLSQECRRLGVSCMETSCSLTDILGRLQSGWIPIVALDWNYIAPVEQFARYNGHFVPIVGWGDDCIFIHNCGPEALVPGAGANVALPRERLEAARTAPGTDCDVLFVRMPT